MGAVGHEAVGERTGRAQHDAGARLEGVAGLDVDEPRADDATPAIAPQRLGAQVVGDGGARRLGVEDVLEHQARVVGLAVDVSDRAGEARGAQVRSEIVELAGRQLAAARRRAPEGERVVERDADAQRGEPRRLAAVAGEDELDRPAQVRRRAHQEGALVQPFEHQPDRRTAGSAGRRGSASTTGSRSRPRSRPSRTARRRARAAPRRGRRRAGGSAADDQQIEGVRTRSRSSVSARRGGRGCVIP